MHGRSEIDSRGGHGGHAGHGFWAMLACCAPMIVIFSLIALKVI
jgi:hypothetical protein